MIDKIVHEILSQGWSFQRDILSASALAAVNSYVEAHRSEFTPAQIGKGDKLQRNESVRGDYTLWVDHLSPPGEFAPIMEFIRQLMLKLNREAYLGLKDFETHLAYYPAGTFYKKHMDVSEQGSSRVVSFIYYLNQHWTADAGGELRMYDKEGKTIQSVLPWGGSLMCFISRDFPHEVLAASAERRSLTGWIHSQLIN